jgi:hypothetical protein
MRSPASCIDRGQRDRHETIGEIMGLSWQQGPLGRNPNGTFLTATPMPERVLYIEPLRRRMSVELGGSIVARSDGAVLLFEPARYPVAYFPLGDVADGVLSADGPPERAPRPGQDGLVRRHWRRRRGYPTGWVAAR